MKATYNTDLAEVCLGKKNAQLVLKGAQVVNVFTNEILAADVAIQDGRIVGV
ncbi:MAG: hypothetical protein ACOX7H_06825 [Bacillota bacterium]|jgi:adenine deaminase